MLTSWIRSRALLKHGVRLSIVVSLVLVITGTAGSRHTEAAALQTLDPCALLTIDEIQPLAGKQQVGPGVSTTVQSLGRLTCRYQWGVGTGRYALDIIVKDASKLPSHMNADVIKQSLVAPGSPGTVSEPLDGIGETAAFRSDSSLLATAGAYVKGRTLQLIFDGYDARAKKDQVVALLKAAAARL
jgi:hypothetical protein